MAKADYIGCAVCDGKALYDGCWEIRDRDDIQVAVLCPQCTETHVLKPELKSDQPPPPSQGGGHA